MAVKVFLGVSVVVWLPYGLFCFVQPSFLGEVAGVVAHSATATTELRAMYGGLQAGIGVLCLIALLRVRFVRPALLALAFLCAGLFTARLAGLAVDGSISGYTAGGLVFELLSSGLAVALLLRGDRDRRAPDLSAD
jgi:hypothetical protein